ncbi:hypothetical protein IM660_11990 [Ruania alkalisoli]|uniref:Uncharacterized protein n=1 Tax=Ruania alkalisoli TaxID=2779775 RepID=A0A7M1SPB2_9MICO|nr:hypothetical protein [Ruania alkalisoli]QOR69416.1 hypothetical protein IM660_11990 [Ruania alkalisoli]
MSKVKISYAELEAFYDDVSSLAQNLDNESMFLEDAAEAVGSPFGQSDLKTAIEQFHQDWNNARDELVQSLESAKKNAVTVAHEWRGIDSDLNPSLPEPPEVHPAQD